MHMHKALEKQLGVIVAGGKNAGAVGLTMIDNGTLERPLSHVVYQDTLTRGLQSKKELGRTIFLAALHTTTTHGNVGNAQSIRISQGKQQHP
jgi:hypothetical protein